MSIRWQFKIEQAGLAVASGEAPSFGQAVRELMHYAMMYQSEGPMRLFVRRHRARWLLVEERP